MVSLARGTLYFTVANIVLVAAGYIIHIYVGRYLGPESYGIFGIIISMITVINVILTTGIPQAGSRFIAMAEDIEKVKKIAINLQIILALSVFIIYFVFSSVIAEILGDPSLSPYIRMSSFIIPIGALNALNGGFLNGLRMYDRQASITFVYCVVKVISAISLILLGFAIYGAIAGYILGPLIGIFIGTFYLKNIKKDKDIRKDKDRNNPIAKNINLNVSNKKMIDFAWPTIIFSFVFLFIINADLFMVKRIIGDNTQVGYYTATSTLSKIPYYVLSGLGFAIFPAISKSSITDTRQVRKYIKESIRYLIIILLPLVFIMSESSLGLVKFFYSERYIDASYPLEILVFGIAIFTIFNIFATIINASGRPRVSMIITIILIPIVIGLNWLLIPMYYLEGAAIATTLSGIFGLTLIGIYILKEFGTFMEIKSFIKILLSSFIIYIISLSIPIKGYILPLWYIVLFGIYFIILVLMKEFNENDIKMFMRTLTGEKNR